MKYRGIGRKRGDGVTRTHIWWQNIESMRKAALKKKHTQYCDCCVKQWQCRESVRCVYFAKQHYNPVIVIRLIGVYSCKYTWASDWTKRNCHTYREVHVCSMYVFNIFFLLHIEQAPAHSLCLTLSIFSSLLLIHSVIYQTRTCTQTMIGIGSSGFKWLKTRLYSWIMEFRAKKDHT